MPPARIGMTLDDGHTWRHIAANAAAENLAGRGPIRA